MWSGRTLSVPSTSLPAPGPDPTPETPPRHQKACLCLLGVPGVTRGLSQSPRQLGQVVGLGGEYGAGGWVEDYTCRPFSVPLGPLQRVCGENKTRGLEGWPCTVLFESPLLCPRSSG